MRTFAGKSFTICIALALCLWAMGAAEAATYYVATNGSDSNPGTSGSPFLTIQKGIDTANAGDTVEVAAGSYRQRLVLDSADGGTPGAPVTIHGASGAIIDASNNESLSFTLQSGYNGGAYRSSVSGNTVAFWDDKSIQEIWWGADSSPHWNFNRLFTYGLKNVSGQTDYDLWGAIPEGWNGIRGFSCWRSPYLWVKLMPNGEGSQPLDVSQETIRVTTAGSAAISIDGANDVIFDGLTIKWAFRAFDVFNSKGCEIKNIVMEPVFHGVRMGVGADGVSVHNCEISQNPLRSCTTRNEGENAWHMNKMGLYGMEPYSCDKYAFALDKSNGNHRIYDNYVHDGAVGYVGGQDPNPATAQEVAKYDTNVELNHNYFLRMYQCVIVPRFNLSYHKYHHNIVEDSKSLFRIYGVYLGPAYFYNNINVLGPMSDNTFVLYNGASGQTPDVYVYNNTAVQQADNPMNTEPGPERSSCYHPNNLVENGSSLVNYHFYNNLWYGDRYAKLDIDDLQWDGDYNVYVRRGTSWKVNCTSGWTDRPTGNDTYAHNQGMDLNSLWTTAAPGFTNFANGDYSLTSTSPARGEGANLYSLFGSDLPGDVSTDCGALAYGQPMLDVPGTSGGAASKPRISSISPTQGGSGVTVTIMGTNLSSASVSFGGNAATNIAVNPAGTHMTCTTPSGSGTVNVTVTNSLGTSNALTYAYGQTVLSPVADAMVYEGSSGTNYGSSNELQNKGQSGYNTKDYLKFDLSSLSGTITSATLKLYNFYACTAVTISAMSVSDDSWTESGITWANRKATGSAQATTSVSAVGWYQWNITSYANSELAGDKTLSICLSDETASNRFHKYYSKEGTYAPVLEITTSAGSTPTLSSINPNNGTTAGGTACTLTGTNLTGCSAVSFGGTAATGIVVDSATQVRCTSPAKSAGTISVTATTSGGTSNGVNYTYNAPTPTLSSINPNSGTTAGGTACTLTGTNLTGCSAVSFGGTAATGVVVDSATQVRCASPAKTAGTYSVTATTAGGTSNGVNFTYSTAAPTLSAINPTSGTTAGGTACTLTGTNLTGCSAVSFGGTAGTGIVVDSATQVRCTSPAKSAGAISVTATTGGGTSNGVTYTYVTPAPTLSSIAPTSGTTAGGTACTLTGTNLTGCSAVSFGGTAGTGIVVDSSTQVRVASPAKSAGTYSVTATTPGGTSNGVNYTYTAGGTSYTATLYPSADAMVYQASSNTNYGSHNELQNKAQSGYNTYDYLKFDLSSVQGVSITSAKLRLYNLYACTAVTVSALTVSVDSWTESGITWANKAATGSAAATASVSSANTWYEWNITSYVSTEFAGDKVVSMCMADTGALNRFHKYNSKEASSNKPQLVVISQS